MKKYSLEITVFLSGAVVMMLELTGSRILAPFVGTSTFIWTSLIGVILASLSFGYYHGGIMADKDPSLKRLSAILFQAGISIGVLALINQTLLSFFSQWIVSVKWSAAVSACLLFGLPAYFLGMVSPQAVRIRMADVKTSGATIGRLYALSSMGSIIGTFAVGFYLMAILGSRNIIFMLSVLTLLLALLNRRNSETIVAVLLMIAAPFFPALASNKLVKVEDTEYSAVQIVEDIGHDGRKLKVMKVGNEYSSGMYLDSDSLAFEYFPYYKLMFYFHPHPLNTLMIGGGAYSVPKYFQKVYPEIGMDVVEIDPSLTDIAIRDFRFVPDAKVKSIHADGRIFINQNQKKYDVILGDAYRSLFSIPFHLVSKEAMQKMSFSLTENGVLIINILSPIEGENTDLLQCFVATCRSVFPEVRAFKPMKKASKDKVQNLMIVCRKSEGGFKPSMVSREMAGMLATEIDLSRVSSDDSFVLTDDFAPVEHFADEMLTAYFQHD